MKTTLSPGAKHRHLFNIALFAGVFEWYEFSIYGLMASIMGKVFFDSADPINNALSTYTVYALSYFARPLGGLFFGRMGDKLSHGQALKLSLMTMAIPTIIIGMLPTYHQAGLWASFSLVILRLIQGFGLGGEFPNSISYLLETSPPRYKTVLGSITCASTSLGMLLGSMVMLGLHTYFDEQTIYHWAWRIPFLLGIPLTILISLIRQSITKFQTPTQASKVLPSSSTNLWEELYKERYTLLKIILIGGMLTTCSNLFLIWMPFYLEHFLHVSPTIATFTNATTLSFEIGILILLGYVMYFLPTEKLLKTLHISLLLLLYPLFHLLTMSDYIGIIVIRLIFGFFVGAINSCFLEIMGRILPSGIRSLGTGIVFSISPAFFGGSAPFLCTWLTHKTGILEAPAFFIMLLGLLALPATFSLKPKLKSI